MSEQTTEAIEMTEELWDELEDSIDQFHNEYLEIDGYKITLRLEKLSKLKLVIGVYVNGWVRGKWCDHENPSEEAKRFFWKTRRQLMSKKELKKLGMKDSDDNYIYFYKPYFKSFRTLKRSFKKNNESIKWLKANNK